VHVGRTDPHPGREVAVAVEALAEGQQVVGLALAEHVAVEGGQLGVERREELAERVDQRVELGRDHLGPQATSELVVTAGKPQHAPAQVPVLVVGGGRGPRVHGAILSPGGADYSSSSRPTPQVAWARTGSALPVPNTSSASSCSSKPGARR